MSAKENDTVPAEVYAALLKANDLAPAGPAGDGDWAQWWTEHAESDEAAEQAYQRLHAWAVATGQPAAVTAAIGEVVTARRLEGERCRREARRERR